jgi:hypothetical protein
MIFRVIQTIIKALPWAVKYEWRVAMLALARFFWWVFHDERLALQRFLMRCGYALGRACAQHNTSLDIMIRSHQERRDA